MSIADTVRADADPYGKAVVWMIWRDCTPTHVVFHFDDGSSVKFKKVYVLEAPE